MLDRNLYRKKVIGGTILGDIWNNAKNILSTGAKKVFSLGKTAAKNLLSTGISVGKETGKELYNQGKDALSTAVAKKSSELASKATNLASNVLSYAPVRAAADLVKTYAPSEAIKALTSNPQIKKLLQEKAKQLDARHILSSIIAGSGVKRLK